MRCSCDPVLDIAPGRGLYGIEFRIARPRARFDAPTAESLEPGAPVAPPAPGLFLCGGEPLFRVRSQFSVYPMAALLFRGGAFWSGPVATPTPPTPPVPPHAPGAPATRAPTHHLGP